MDSSFRGEAIIQCLDAVWFFCNVLASPSPLKTKTDPTNQNKSSLHDTESNKPETPITHTQPIDSSKAELFNQEESPKPIDSAIYSFPARASTKCFKVEEEEQKKKKQKQKIINKRRELTINREIDFEILMMGVGGLSFEQVLPRMYYKDDKAMKRHLRSWAATIGSNLAQNNDSRVAACS